MSSSEEKNASPFLPKDSDQDSSVSSELQDEYEELLRYAVVTPKFEPSVLRQSVHTEVHQKSAGKGPVMDGRRLETAGPSWRKHGRAPDFAPSTRTTRIEVSTAIKEPSRTDMEGLCPVDSEESSSQESSCFQRDLQESNVTDLSLSDERVTQIESILDLWSGSLKIIANLTHAVEKQKDRIELMKKFAKWRLQHSIGRQEAKQEVYTNRLADRLYEMGLLKKAWMIWRSQIHTKWKETMERACQSSAESVRVELSNDYETKLQESNTALEQARAEIIDLQNKRQDYEDAMKKAFMRGVCALNLEAMTVFQGKEFKFDHVELSDKRGEPSAGNGGSTPKLPPSHFDPPLPPNTPPPPPRPPPPPPTAAPGIALTEDLFPSHQSHAVTSQTRLDSGAALIAPSSAAASGIPSITKAPLTRVVTAHQKAGRTITARITGRSDFASKNRIFSSLDVIGVSPPMNSVIVEKHHPVTQQTISQATAAKYPRTVFSNGISPRPSGHSRKTHAQTHSNIHSIKVVE
ncbi:centrosomal protein POC5 isoform X3 [Anolis carolinensis]|uniref:centrosomal protein POC5 isoform X3 n=1 Tax=Anolis carolinensis TaxID=28377 RepID=UPI002F2B640F